MFTTAVCCRSTVLYEWIRNSYCALVCGIRILRYFESQSGVHTVQVHPIVQHATYAMHTTDSSSTCFQSQPRRWIRFWTTSAREYPIQSRCTHLVVRLKYSISLLLRLHQQHRLLVRCYFPASPRPLGSHNAIATLCVPHYFHYNFVSRRRQR